MNLCLDVILMEQYFWTFKINNKLIIRILPYKLLFGLDKPLIILIKFINLPAWIYLFELPVILQFQMKLSIIINTSSNFFQM